METRLNVELGEYFDNFICQQIKNGNYRSEDEIISVALAMLKEKEDYFRDLQQLNKH